MSETARESILVVDDTPANIQVLANILSQQRFTVRLARNGDLALKSAARHPPDLILLDIRMPGIDGFEVCARLKADAATRDIPVIFLSALDDSDSKLRAFSTGAVDYVTKPFDAQEIMARVGTHLQLRRLQKTLAQQNQDLRATRDSLRQQRNFIDTVLDTAAALVVVYDHDGRILRFNHACEQTSGLNEAAVLSQDFTCVIASEDIDAARHCFRAMVEHGAPLTCEYGWQHAEGEVRRIAWNNTVLTNAGGQVTHVVATGIDVTDQRRAEGQTRQHLEDLAQLQRVYTAGELATMLAHEINQPLLAITNYCEAARQMLARPEPDLDRLGYNLEQINAQGLRAGRTIRQLRNFIGRGKIDPVALDLNALIIGVADMMRERLKARGIDIVLDLSETLPPVLAVDVHVEQVLINLLRNAMDAIRDARMASARVTVRSVAAGGMAQVSVEDEGPGVDAQSAKMLFEPFRTSKRYGLGVGLRICRSLVEAHNGKIWISPQNPGGRLHFTLPLVQ